MRRIWHVWLLMGKFELCTVSDGLKDLNYFCENIGIVIVTNTLVIYEAFSKKKVNKKVLTGVTKNIYRFQQKSIWPDPSCHL